MLSRRQVIGALALTGFSGFPKTMGTSEVVLPSIALTFDEWPEAATEAFGIMMTHGLVGTYFVTPTTIDAAGGPTTNTLLAMKQYGWEIGVYGSSGVAGQNLVQLEASNRITANQRLLSLKAGMEAKGFPVSSIAPNQRAWNTKLRNLAEGIYDRVRVAADFRATLGYWQSLPVPDPLYVKNGGSQSLSSTDTAPALCATVDDLIALGGAWIVVIHRVSDDGLNPGSTITKSVFSSLCAKIAAEVALGNLRCVRFCDL